MIPLIKNIEIGPAQHLLKLVSRLEPATHTEQVNLPVLLHNDEIFFQDIFNVINTPVSPR